MSAWRRVIVLPATWNGCHTLAYRWQVRMAFDLDNQTLAAACWLTAGRLRIAFGLNSQDAGCHMLAYRRYLRIAFNLNNLHPAKRLPYRRLKIISPTGQRHLFFMNGNIFLY